MGSLLAPRRANRAEIERYVHYPPPGPAPGRRRLRLGRALHAGRSAPSRAGGRSRALHERTRRRLVPRPRRDPPSVAVTAGQQRDPGIARVPRGGLRQASARRRVAGTPGRGGGARWPRMMVRSATADKPTPTRTSGYTLPARLSATGAERGSELRVPHRNEAVPDRAASRTVAAPSVLSQWKRSHARSRGGDLQQQEGPWTDAPAAGGPRVIPQGRWD
jgi:hypothetical protein